MSSITAIAPGRSYQMLGGASRDMASGERSILSRESALKSAAAGYDSRTTYTYAMGPDGRRYIVGAEVSIVAPERVLDSVPGGTRTGRSYGGDQAERTGDTPSASRARGASEGGRTEDAVAELKRTEREVIAHETAHKAAAGRFGGPVVYSYTTGPDGKRYISGGSVQVHTPATSDPEEALRNARQVMSAALAPGDPSGPDLAVAANAAAIASSARADIASESAPDAATQIPEKSAKKIKDSYADNASPKGLWTALGGYDGDGSDAERAAPLDIAA
jgi:hypothetical protein